MQGAQVLRNKAYLLFAAMMKDAAQRSSWGDCAMPSISGRAANGLAKYEN
jgi:hypothetical protein